MTFLKENFIQQKTILEAIFNFLETGTGQAIHIYGMPGTGKTYTVKNIINILKGENEILEECELSVLIRKIKKFKYLLNYVNCANFNSFKKMKLAPKNHILFVDEIDIVKNENTLYYIFDSPNRKSILLFVISNIFTSSHFLNKVSDKVISRMGNNKIKFEPYSSAELERISGNRISAKYLSAFGDMRRVKNTDDFKHLDGKEQIQKIRKIYEPQFKKLIRCLNCKQKLLLRIISEDKLTYEEFIYRCNLLDIEKITYSEYLILLEELEDMGFLKNMKLTYLKEEIINFC